MLFLLLFLSGQFASYAFAESGGGLLFGDAWSRATVPGAKSAAIYGELINNGQGIIMIEAIKSDISEMGMIHETSIVDGVMRMRHKQGFSLSPGERVVLAPGALHIMLTGVVRQLTAGEVFEVEIIFSEGSHNERESLKRSVEVPVTVGKMGQLESSNAGRAHHNH